MIVVVRSAFAAVLVFVLAAASGCAVKQHSSGDSGPSPQEERKITVARVNGAPISRYALSGMTRRMTEIDTKTSSSETADEARRKALDQLIFRELAYQQAVRTGVRIEDQRVDAEMDRFIMSVGHEDGYHDYLAREGLTPVEVRSEIERGLMLQRMAIVEVVQKVTVTDEDVLKEYERRKAEFVAPEQRWVSEVVFFPVRDDTLRKAEEIRRNVSASKARTFDNLVSDGTFTVRSRQVEKAKEPEVYEAVLKLKEGDLSDVIRTDQGVFIERLERIVPPQQAGFEDVKKSLKERLIAVGQMQRFQEWEQELKKDAAIEILDPSLRKK